MDGVTEVPRLARLARLELGDDEAVALARSCAQITTAFSDLAAYAATLPPAPDEPSGALREDAVDPAPPSEVEGILAAAPRVDAATRSVLAPRGGG